MTDGQHQQIIIAETQTTGDPVVPTLVPMWWNQQTDRGKSGYTAYLYTKQAVLRYLLGLAKRRRDITIGPNRIMAVQLFQNALAELKDWTEFIAKTDPDFGASTISTSSPVARMDVLDSVEDAYQFYLSWAPELEEIGWA